MTKRRLTQQQRIQQAQSQAARIKRSENSEDSQLTNLGPEQPGLLITHHGIHVIIESQNGTLHHCKIRQNLDALVSGDHIIWQEAPDGTGIVVARLKRKSVLARPNLHASDKSVLKPIAANIDLLVIVIAPKPVLSITTLDAYLIIAEQLNIQPLILINKSDLLSSLPNDPFLERLSIYQALGYESIEISTLADNQGLVRTDNRLCEALKNKTSVLIGQSGVGKSSLIQYLYPQVEIRIGDLCATNEVGKHTTTGSRLYHLPTGGDLIDSPGIRSFGLWHLSEKELAQSFVEFKPYLGQCQFRNCRHHNELGCAIIKARDQGLIHPLRIQNFHELLKKQGSEL